MATLGSMLMMFKGDVATDGMYSVLKRLHDLDLHVVEVSQIPMNEANTADLERARLEFGMRTGALSVALAAGPTATGDALDVDYAKIVDDCRRLECHIVRIGMMPFTAMASKEACEAWARDCEAAAQRLQADGIVLCYHNHHVDLAQFDGERIFDIVRRVAPTMQFEVDLHWVQRGGMAPLDMLRAYSGVCRTIHVKDFRVVPVSQETVDHFTSRRMAEAMAGFANIVQFAEVGSGNMNWPELLPAAEAAGAEFFFIEQDDTYGRDPFDSVAQSRRYLATLGY